RRLSRHRGRRSGWVVTSRRAGSVVRRSELADLASPALFEDRASLGEGDRGLEVVGPDERVPAEHRVGGRTSERAPADDAVAPVDDVVAELVEPGGPLVDGL